MNQHLWLLYILLILDTMYDLTGIFKQINKINSKLNDISNKYNMKLYKLTNKIGDWYVIAEDPTKAEYKLMAILDGSDYGYYKDRIVTNFELITKEADINSISHNNHLII